ncbi:MAG: hypothetical protein HQK53_06945, partial [Oligoflexia bacterium]|nr:hypothetical protein [Oligoflexia bacterium]
NVDTVKCIAKNLSSNVRQDLMDFYQGPPQSLRSVEDAWHKLLKILLEKIEKKEIIIDRDGEEKLV